MALCSDCDARIEYNGSRTQTDYTFPFEYDDRAEVFVSVYSPEEQDYVNITQGNDWRFVNLNTIRLTEPTTNKLVIYRCTDLDAMDAIFSPGHPIKAADLNNDFDQLRHAIIEGRCNDGYLKGLLDEIFEFYLNGINSDCEYRGIDGDLVMSNSSLKLTDEHVGSTLYIDNRYWNKCENTTFQNDNWVDETDDIHIPTTAAVEQRLADFKALTNVNKVTGYMQRNQQWDESVTNDDNLATTEALVERHDNYLADANTKYPDSYWLQPGKLWIKGDTAELFFRRDEGYQWIQLDTKGDQGPPGNDSTVPGPPGEGATITIGNTTTGEPNTDAEVINTGTETNAVLEFTIPKGEKGEKGDPGDGAGEILTFTDPLVKTGTVVSFDLQTLVNAP
jgi:hypothetical protein